MNEITNSVQVKRRGGLNGITIADLRNVIAMHKIRGSISKTDLREKLGCSSQKFGRARDIILLAERKDLAVREKTAVALAMQQLEAGLPVAIIYQPIKPIALRIWGSRRWRYKTSRPERAFAALSKAVSIITTLCEHSAELTVPNLTMEKADAFTKQLKTAKASLSQLNKRISKQRRRR